MEYRLSRHAEEQLIVRDISRAMLDAVLQNPDQRLPSEGRWIYQSKVIIEGRPFLLRAVVDENGVPALVITVYRTSKITQYWKAS